MFLAEVEQLAANIFGTFVSRGTRASFYRLTIKDQQDIMVDPEMREKCPLDVLRHPFFDSFVDRKTTGKADFTIPHKWQKTIQTRASDVSKTMCLRK